VLRVSGVAGCCVVPRHQILCDDDLFDCLEPRLVERQNGVSGELCLLQLANHIAVVGGGPSVLPCDLRGKRSHLCLDPGEGFAGLGCKLCRGKIDASVFQAEGALLGCHAEVDPGLGHYGFAGPGIVVSQFLLQLCERPLPSGQLVLDEQRSHAVDVVFIAF
jgi:hypothetical protein